MGFGEYNYKSSGIKLDNRKFSKPRRVLRPIGIKTPMSIGDGLFSMHKDPGSTISDNFRNLVMTNFGERLGRYEFGTNLRASLFELSAHKDFETKVSQIIVDATQKFIPQVNINNISIEQIDSGEKFERNRTGLAIVKITIVYTIPVIHSKLLGLEVEFLLGG